MTETIIGIDLGTTNSEVAVLQNGEVVVIADNDSKLLPSFVGIADDGAILVGDTARNQYPLYPKRTVKSIKRKMGSEEAVEMAGKAYKPQEISAIILQRLKKIAEAYLQQTVHKAVITVPAYFNDAQRQATREAGEIAGLDVVRIINEPTAAALSYESSHHGHKHILVYDLGGGTFDVSLVRMEDDVVEVVASHGNNHLGGDDFDQKIIDHIVARLKQEQDVDAASSSQALARIGRAAESAKMALSDQPFVSIEEEYLLQQDGKPVHLSLELNRHDYEAMIEPYIQETLDAVHIALKGAGMTVADIDEILLVGGATRTPLVSGRLQAELGRQPRGEVNPDLCVAMGAAIQAAVIGGERVSAVLVDITPYTFGTSALGDIGGIPTVNKYVPIIHKNTAIPVTKSEVFFTSYDDQKVVDVRIYQGEDIDALNNIQIGEFIVEGLSKSPAGNPIVLKLALDVNGILNVSAVEKKTGLQKSITINNAMSRFEQQEMDQARARVQALFDEDAAQEGELIEARESEAPLQHALVPAQALVEKAERMLDGATSEDRDDMVNLIEAINDGIAAGDPDALKKPLDELSDILFYLES